MYKRMNAATVNLADEPGTTAQPSRRTQDQSANAIRRKKPADVDMNDEQTSDVQPQNHAPTQHAMKTRRKKSVAVDLTTDGTTNAQTDQRVSDQPNKTSRRKKPLNVTSAGDQTASAQPDRLATEQSTKRARRKKPATVDLTDDQTAKAQPNHRRSDLPKSVLRPTIIQSVPLQTKKSPTSLTILAKEFEAIRGLNMLKHGVDASAVRKNELTRLEKEDPVAHYYAQTVAERAPFQLQAAAALFQMSGGDIAEPVAALTLMKARREEQERAQQWYAAKHITALRGAKAAKEAAGAAEMPQPDKRGRKRRLSADGVGEDEPAKKKVVRFGRGDE